MPIIVLTKKNLLIALLCVALLAGGVFLWLWLRDRPRATETASVMAQVENYELNVLPMKDRQLPVYGVGLLSEMAYPSRIKLMQQLYPTLSQRHNSSPVMVDRAMRHGVESCWRLAGKAVQRQYFGYSAQDKQGHAHQRGIPLRRL